MAAKSETKTVAPVDIYKMFGTDTKKEQEGIILNYSDVFWLRVARAGGSNENYKRILTEKTRPYRKAIQTETISPETSARIMREAAAEGLVLEWGSAQYGDGLIPRKSDGAAMPFSIENVVQFFEDLPEIFADVQEQSGKVAHFTVSTAEVDAGN